MKKLLAPIALTALMLTGCGGVEKDATYESVSELREAVIDSGFECPGETVENDEEYGEEFIKCSQNMGLSVYADEDTLSMAKVVFSIGDNSMLSGPNWLIRGDADRLAEIKESLGGELTVP